MIPKKRAKQKQNQTQMGSKIEQKGSKINPNFNENCVQGGPESKIYQKGTQKSQELPMKCEWSMSAINF